MKKIFLAMFMVICAMQGHAQDSATYVKRYNSIWRSVNVGYHINYFKTKPFQQYYSEGFNSDFGSQLNSIVVEAWGPENYLEDVFVSAQYYLPSQFNSGDTLRSTLQGFSFESQFLPGYNLFYTQKEIDLPIYGFWQIGSLFLKQNNQKSHNFFLNFGVRAALRVLILKRVTLGISADISWDVTKDHWKYQRKVEPEIPGFKKTSYGVQVNLGWRYTKRQADWMRIYK